ncbi:MAG TPA: cell division protein ZapA [Chitinophagaceae bacterium]|jgi:Cell division protein ZapA|nr:cell division protein ZapA [Chitinophagaceae bacterium]
MNELIPINLLVGDRTYRVRVEPKDEEVVRKTIKVINDKIIEFKTQFAGKDMQDYIGMVILWYATQQSGANLPAVNEITDRLEKLELLIDRGLEQ